MQDAKDCYSECLLTFKKPLNLDSLKLTPKEGALKETELKRIKKEQKRLEKQLKKRNPAIESSSNSIWQDCERLQEGACGD